MSNEVQVKKLTDIMAQFVGFTAKKLPDDVIAKLQELRDKEDSPMTKVIYDTMFRNQELALKLNRPSCQDTGVLQFWVKCGTKFPLIDNLEALLKDAVMQATVATPLRHNSVETFDEYNTGKNVGKGTPTVWWDIVPNSDKCEIYTYMAGGGCTLPGNATVLMPGEGYEGVTKFVLDRMTTYGLNACPPLLVGVGVGTSVETAALNSKKALMRPVGSHNDNANAAKMEKLLEDGINAIGLGPQGMGCSKRIRTKIYCYIAVGGLLWSNWCEYKEKLGNSFMEYAPHQYQYAKEYSYIALLKLQEMERTLHA